MIPLHAKLPQRWDGEPRIVRLGDAPLDIALPPELAYLSDGDIIEIAPRGGHVNVIYRRSSPFNSLLLTEACNSLCLMCSQPPRRDNGHAVRVALAAIPLMSPDTTELGLTGGEPTLLGERYLDVVRMARDHLPTTGLHTLSNGRTFRDLRWARSVASLRHPDLVFGVPLYADVAEIHDHVVQAAGAFDETIRGLLNAARCGLRVEIRVVLHALTVPRLPALARFIARNLPFAEHVALMGMELMGYARPNLDTLWIDPLDYQAPLLRAVDELVPHGMNISLYNLPLCTLDRELWPYARRSISDWKNEYAAECGGCEVREECGGFFSSARLRMSRGVAPLGEEARRHLASARANDGAP